MTVQASLDTHLELLHQGQCVVPHLDGARQLAGQGHAQHHAVGGSGEDPPQDDAFAECMWHDGRHDDQDGRKEIGSAVEVTQVADLPRQRHLIPDGKGEAEKRRSASVPRTRHSWR